MNLVFYNEATGRIHRVVANVQAEVRQRYLDEAGDDTVLETTERPDPVEAWVDNGDAKPRETQPTTVSVGTGEATVANLPGPATVYCLGQSEHTSGADVTIQFDVPGAYTLRVVTDSAQWYELETEVDVP